MSDLQASALFDPYDPKTDGGWNRQAATHLLWRTGFGATHDEIEQATAEGLDKTLDRILQPQPEDGVFESTAELLHNTAIDTGNIADLKAWWLYRMLNSANPLVEKMSLFWHNHFATSYAKVQSVDQMAAQNALIRAHAVGSFRKLLHGMSRDVAMLVWLDSNSNRKRQANENFAREVMELFSLGEGNYTEQDIKQAARAFTGWHVRDGKFWFNRSQHDFETKTVFGKSADMDGDDVIDLCLEQLACPRFLAVKLLRQFVTPQPTEAMVAAFAARVRLHDFKMTVLRDLFGSRLFFSQTSRRAIIKSPIEFVLGAFRALEVQPNLQTASRMLAELGQDVFEPATVKGWEGGRLWINSTTLLQRTNLAAELTKGNRLGAITDPAGLIEEHGLTDNAAIVRHYSNLLLASELSPEMQAHLEKPLRQSAGNKSQQIRGLIYLIMAMPEYQLV